MQKLLLFFSFYEQGLKGKANYQVYFLNGQTIRGGTIELIDGENLLYFVQPIFSRIRKIQK